MSNIYLRNWRDFQPKITHLSAVHWGGLRGIERDSDDERDCLQRLGGFARHALQGRKTSDHHKHDNLEQVYYILSGTGEVLFEGERHPVEAGDGGQERLHSAQFHGHLQSPVGPLPADHCGAEQEDQEEGAKAAGDERNGSAGRESVFGGILRILPYKCVHAEGPIRLVSYNHIL